MDEARRFRFLISPFFLLTSLAIGYECSGKSLIELLNRYKDHSVLATAVVGASILPVGFLLTSFSLSLIRAYTWVRYKAAYEVGLSEQALDQIWPILRTTLPRSDPRWRLYAAATFDHEVVPRGVHEWVQRRWNTYNVAIHAIVAFWTAHLAALGDTMLWPRSWIGISIAVSTVLGISAWHAYRETMRMLEFQASRPLKTVAATPRALLE